MSNSDKFDSTHEALVESEEKFRILAEQSPNMIFINQGGRVIYANKRCEEVMRYSREEFYSPEFDFMSLIASEYKDSIMNAFGEHMQGREVEPFEYAVVTRDGKRIESFYTTKLIKYKGEHAILGTITDITERKRMENALRKARDNWRNIFESIGDMVIILDREHRIIDVNVTTMRALGLEKDSVIGQCCYKILHGTDKPPEGCPQEQLLYSEHPEQVEMEIEVLGGKYQVTTSPVFNETGQVEKVLHIIRDITEQKRSEEALRDSEEKFRRLVEDTLQGVIIIQDGRVIFANQSAQRLVNYTLEELCELSNEEGMELIHPEDREMVFNHMRARLSGERTPETLIYRVIRKGGEVRWAEGTTSVTEYKGEPAVQIYNTDITERKETEEQLRESEEKYRTQFNSIPNGIVISDMNGRILDANQPYQDMLGYTLDELKEMNYQQFTPEKWHELEAKKFKEFLLVGHGTLEKEYVRKDGTVFPISLTGWLIKDKEGNPTTIVAFVEDITQRKKSEEQLRQTRMELEHASRLITAGELTTGLAHELNQPLCAVTNYADACSNLLNEKVINIMKLKEVIKEIAEQANRAGDIIRHVRKLVRKHEPTRSKVHINDIVKEVVKLEAAEANQQNVDIKVRLAKDLPEVWLDVIEIEQVLMNLISNAFEAMVEVPIKKRRLEIQTLLREDENILISIEDSGKGISEEEINKVFDSFFTTKTGGLGIGLSLSRSIVESHGGRMWVKPNRKGAIFQFTLPLKGEENGQI
ncbi:MAG: PAS domain-containing protein [Planctomycetota bacterium]|jgi:two-component system sensor kinase FixL